MIALIRGFFQRSGLSAGASINLSCDIDCAGAERELPPPSLPLPGPVNYFHLIIVRLFSRLAQEVPACKSRQVRGCLRERDSPFPFRRTVGLGGLLSVY